MRRLACLALSLALRATPAYADDVWTHPHAGIARLERTAPGPLRIHAVIADLCTPRLTVRATRPEERGATVADFAADVGASVAINGDFFEATFAPVGLAIGDGRRWADSRDGRWGVAAFGPGQSAIVPPEDDVEPPAPWMAETIGGIPQLVLDGLVLDDDRRFCAERHPRTALGLSADRRTLILAVVEGRSARSTGATCRELGALMRELGAHDALNLDGGGSSALFVEGGGIVNTPSDPRERPVANHLALIADGRSGVHACPSTLAPPPGGLPRCEVTVDADGAPRILEVDSPCFAPSGRSMFEAGGYRFTPAVACDASREPRGCPASDTSARWYFNVAQEGAYRVEARIPRHDGAVSTRARYRVAHVGGTVERTIDASAAAGRWVTIATLALRRQNNVFVELHDNTGEPYDPAAPRAVVFDAIRVRAIRGAPRRRTRAANE